MNSKDYKEIAKIMKNSMNKGNMILYLADYFEREYYKDSSISSTPFNKKQFLKDCGVEE